MRKLLNFLLFLTLSISTEFSLIASEDRDPNDSFPYAYEAIDNEYFIPLEEDLFIDIHPFSVSSSQVPSQNSAATSQTECSMTTTVETLAESDCVAASAEVFDSIPAQHETSSPKEWTDITTVLGENAQLYQQQLNISTTEQSDHQFDITDVMKLTSSSVNSETAEIDHRLDIAKELELTEAPTNSETVEIDHRLDIAKELELIEAPTNSETAEIDHRFDIAKELELIEASTNSETAEIDHRFDIAKELELIEAPTNSETVEIDHRFDIAKELELIEAPTNSQTVELNQQFDLADLLKFINPSANVEKAIADLDQQSDIADVAVPTNSSTNTEPNIPGEPQPIVPATDHDSPTDVPFVPKPIEQIQNPPAPATEIKIEPTLIPIPEPVIPAMTPKETKSQNNIEVQPEIHPAQQQHQPILQPTLQEHESTPLLHPVTPQVSPQVPKVETPHLQPKPKVEVPKYTVVDDKSTLSILTPSFYNRRTAKIILENGLEAYIISDPSATQSAAAIAVKVGSWSDPEQHPGMAHFLEHMLFLGNSKYPNESEYHTFVKEHGGMTNAYTSYDHTTFMFSINNDNFESAIDRFSWFFRDPLFNPSGVNREMQAVDQEFSKNIERDEVREMQVLKEIANGKHPFHRFSMGNFTTLSKVSQEELKKFYLEHYSANLMRLVVYSPLPLEKLQTLVAEGFSHIPNRSREVYNTRETIFPASAEGKVLYIKPIKNLRQLSLLWALPQAFSNQIEKKPQDIVAFILGHEGERSLLAQLKREGLAESLAAGGYHLNAQTLLFTIEIGLTDEGLKKKDIVIQRIFQAIALLRNRQVPSYIFDEMKRMQTYKYQYPSRINPFELVEKDAAELIYEDLATFPQYSRVIQTFDQKLISSFIDQLIPKKGIYTIVAPEELTAVALSSKEKWIGVPYAIKSIPISDITAWNNAKPHPSIDFPQINPLIPEHLTLVNSTGSKPHDQNLLIPVPEAIVDDSGFGKVYFEADSRFQIPEIDWIFSIKSAEISSGNATSLVLADLYAKAITDQLNAYAYMAHTAGLQFEIIRKEDAIQLRISGYSENASKVFERVIKEMKELKPNPDKFKLYIAELQRKYENASKDGPLDQAREILRSIIYENYVTDSQKLEASLRIAFAQFETFCQGIFDRNYLEAMIYGNLTRETAKGLWDHYHTVIGGRPFPKAEQKLKEVIFLPPSRGPYYITKTIATEGNAALLAIQNGPFSFKARAANQILGRSMEEAFFAALRTEQQTGYIVMSVTQEIERQLFSLFAVQSASHNVRDLLARFELFIESYIRDMHLNTSHIERFAVVKDSLITLLSSPPKNMGEMTDILNLLAFQYDGDFAWITKRIQGLQALSYAEYVQYAQMFLGRANHQRIAILVKGRINEDVAFDYKYVPTVQVLREHSMFLSRDEITHHTNPWENRKELEKLPK